MAKRTSTILAEAFGWESNDVAEHRYQYGRTCQPVFAFDDGYYCVTRSGDEPKDAEWAWEVWSGTPWLANPGMTIWHAKTETP